jgi:hypothetical protein
MTTRKLSRLAIAAMAVFAIAGAVPALAQRGGGGFHGGGGGGFHGGGGSFHGAVGGFRGGGFRGGGFRGGTLGHGGVAGYRGGWGGRDHGWGGAYGWGGGGFGWGGYGAGWLGYGLLFSTLPYAYSTYYWDGVPYYYADDNYYQWDSAADEYETVQPPAQVATQAAADSQAALAQTELFAYPNNGQSASQQAKDRADCKQWAIAQSGTDPAKRNDYLKAEDACLSGRGYTVR